MKTQLAYCSACDRDVQVLVTDTTLQDGQANIPDAEVVCIEIGQHCTGTLCPVGGVSTAAMRVRRIRNGVRDVLQPVIEAHCDECGRVTPHYLVDTIYATCGECCQTVERGKLVLALGRDG